MAVHENARPDDPVDPSGSGSPRSDLVAVARRLADEVLAPSAEDVDRAEVVPAAHLAALADAGLFGIAGPTSLGGADLGARAARRVTAAVGGGCGATFFTWVQHHGVVRTLRSSGAAVAAEALPGLVAGDEVAGTMFAHVRRTGRPAVTASRTSAGWRLDGFAPWATSWGIADRFAVAAVGEVDEVPVVVWGLLDGPDGEGRGAPAGVSAEELPLPVFRATRTVAVAFDGCDLPDERVVAVEPLEAWRRADARRACIGQPAVLGVAARAIEHLAALGTDGASGDDDAGDAAARLAAELAARWVDDDELVERLAAPGPSEPRDAGPSEAQLIEAGSAHRAACLDLARRATTGLLAATGGRGMALDHPAQRLAREADFYVIQAQTAAGRRATLRSL